MVLYFMFGVSETYTCHKFLSQNDFQIYLPPKKHIKSSKIKKKKIFFMQRSLMITWLCLPFFCFIMLSKSFAGIQSIPLKFHFYFHMYIHVPMKFHYLFFLQGTLIKWISRNWTYMKLLESKYILHSWVIYGICLL